jgi:thiol-disulfide isomerase/thioredoxin
MKRPEVPAIPIVNGKADSLYPYRFVKEHYWDDVNFFDDRLLRTPFFEPKMDDYFKYQVSPESDSIIKEVKYMLLSARTGKEMFPYLLTKFTNKYVNPEYMGQDKVFLYLFNEFYSKGDTVFLNAASRKMIFDRAYSLMANQIGEPAAVLNLTDTLGKTKSMYSLDAKFTLVLFWDPHCGHCKEQLPRVDSIYQAKWKALGLKVYAVYVYDDNVPDWKKFITEKKLFDWTHVYQTKEAKEAEIKSNQPGFRQLYDARLTPTLYLLDEQKRIIAKQLSIEQFDDVIAAKIKNKTIK